MTERRRVLIVEDDPGVRQVIVDALEMEDYQVRSAEDGQAALAVLADWRPAVILLDLMMPGMNGWQFRDAQLARDDLRDIPVVVVSAARDLGGRAEQLRAAAIIPKPFDIDHMLDTVDKLTS